jgi:hypothetical protein
MLNYASCEVSILVNGNSVKTHFKGGKSYIEAKEGSEYEILIKNNGGGRALVVASVDGLNVLTGESASTVDSGYVVNGYSNCKIKGFRYNNDKVGAFKFSKKSESYAKSKHDGSESNCGIIGVAIYGEDFPTQTWTITNTPSRFNTDPLWSTVNTSALGGNNSADDYTWHDSSAVKSVNACSLTSTLRSSSPVLDFDMGTGWGKSKDSKVVDTEFVRGLLLATTDIYYASRDSLLEMGVIVQNTTQVSFPKSFPRYAKPPAGWVA